MREKRRDECIENVFEAAGLISDHPVGRVLFGGGTEFGRPGLASAAIFEARAGQPCEVGEQGAESAGRGKLSKIIVMHERRGSDLLNRDLRGVAQSVALVGGKKLVFVESLGEHLPENPPGFFRFHGGGDIAQARYHVGVLEVPEMLGERAIEVVTNGVVRVPGFAGAQGDAVPGTGQGVEVAVVAPVGVDQAGGAVRPAGAGEGVDVALGDVHGVEDPFPARRAGTDESFEARSDQVSGCVVGGVIVVTPVQQGGVSQFRRDEFGVMADDIRPKLRSSARGGAEAVGPFDLFNVGAGLLIAGQTVAVAAGAQVPRLVAADIDHGGRERREKVVPDALHQPVRLGIEAVQGETAGAPGPVQLFPGNFRFDFGEMAVSRQGEDAAHVAEGGHGRDQGDEPFAAIGVELADFLGRETFAGVADFRVKRKSESVFDVKLELVGFECGESIDEKLQGAQRWDFAAGDVVEQAAGGEIGPIQDATAGQDCGFGFLGGGGMTIRFDDPAKGLQSVEAAGRGCPNQFHGVGRDRESMAVGMGKGRAVYVNANARGRRPRREPREQFAGQAMDAKVVELDVKGGGAVQGTGSFERVDATRRGENSIRRFIERRGHVGSSFFGRLPRGFGSRPAGKSSRCGSAPNEGFSRDSGGWKGGSDYNENGSSRCRGEAGRRFAWRTIMPTPVISDPWRLQRYNMVETQIRERGVRNERVLEAMRTIPREEFLPESARGASYEDRAVPIGQDQTISQPFIVAFMTEQLEVGPEHRVLEIGTGSGYQTAVLARLCRHVFTIERLPSLSERAAATLGAMGIANVSYRVGDGSVGWPEEAPFDRILVTAAAPRIPLQLVAQLSGGGRMILPVGSDVDQTISRVYREGSRVIEIPLLACRFVKLIGRDAWPG